MSKIAPFPHHYSVSLANGHITAPHRAPIVAGGPPQFGGTDETVWSPEDLLVAATLECLWTTFKAYARHDKLDVQGFSGSGTAVLEKGTAAAPPTFSSITLAVEVVVAPGDEERTLRLLQVSEERCIISHALRVPVRLEPTVRTEGVTAPLQRDAAVAQHDQR